MYETWTLSRTPLLPTSYVSLPRALLQRDLHQICAEAVQLAEARAPESSRQEELGRAQRLLMAAAGIDVEANAREAQQLDLKVGVWRPRRAWPERVLPTTSSPWEQSVFSPTDGGAGAATADVTAFVAQLHTSATESVMAQAHADARPSAGRRHWRFCDDSLRRQTGPCGVFLGVGGIRAGGSRRGSVYFWDYRHFGC